MRKLFHELEAGSFTPEFFMVTGIRATDLTDKPVRYDDGRFCYADNSVAVSCDDPLEVYDKETVTRLVGEVSMKMSEMPAEYRMDLRIVPVYVAGASVKKERVMIFETDPVLGETLPCAPVEDEVMAGYGFALQRLSRLSTFRPTIPTFTQEEARQLINKQLDAEKEHKELDDRYALMHRQYFTVPVD